MGFPPHHGIEVLNTAVIESRKAVLAQSLVIASLGNDDSIAEETVHEATGVVGLLVVVRATDEELNKQRRRGNKYTTWNNKIH